MPGLTILASAYEMLLFVIHRVGKFVVHHFGNALKLRWFRAFVCIALWGLCVCRLNRHGPLFVRFLTVLLPEDVTVWQIILTLLLLYSLCRMFSNAVKDWGVRSPELVDKLYSPSFSQATELTTILDAGFWTTMVVEKGWARDIASLVFTLYYAFVPAQAHEKVSRVRAAATVEHLRISWDKATTLYLKVLGKLLRPRFTKYSPREILIQRPHGSSNREPITAWLYFDGSLLELQKQTSMVLDIPGGGFVAMNPRTADDRLLAWAGKARVPILSLDYKKAPEYPYPHALNECFDVYKAIIQTRGSCLGLRGDLLPHIVVSGDSAGGNLAASMVLKILSSTDALPAPEGLVLAYPCLNMKVEAWMNPEQVSLVGNKVMASSGSSGQTCPQNTTNGASEQVQDFRPEICVSSTIAFMDDRILTSETMRALVLLYIGSRNHVDFATDYLLSPVITPPSLLARFHKTYIVTGERDPMVDDTVVFAGRVRQAKFQHFAQQAGDAIKEFNPREHVDLSLIRGVSHGFLQMAGFFPEGWNYIFQCAGWISELLAAAEGKQRPFYVNETKMTDLIGEEELLGRRMKFLAGGLIGH